MYAEKALYNMMATDSALTSVVPIARINPSLIPLGSALPAIAYSLVSRFEKTANALTTIVVRSRLQVTIAVGGVTPTSYSSVKSIAKLVKNACNHKRGIFNGVDVKSCIFELDGADFRDDTTGITYTTIDFRIVTLE